MSSLKIFVFSFFALFFFAPGATAAQYTVKTGDGLQSVARQHGVGVNEIIAANNLTKTILQPNQVLIIPEKSAVTLADAAKPKSAPAIYYTVKRGDTLSAIAHKAGVSIKQITARNDVDPQNLRVGQKLLISKPNNLTPNEPASKETENAGATGAFTRAQNEEYHSQELLGTWNSPDERHLLVKVATSFLGAPYKLGGASMRGIDCSAYVRMIYSIFGIELPRNARGQSNVGVWIDRKELVEGDLVFFHTRRPFGHVGIYIGNNQFVHASSTRKVIRIDSMDTPYFQKRFQRAVRIKGLDEGDV